MGVSHHFLLWRSMSKNSWSRVCEGFLSRLGKVLGFFSYIALPFIHLSPPSLIPSSL